MGSNEGGAWYVLWLMGWALRGRSGDRTWENPGKAIVVKVGYISRLFFSSFFFSLFGWLRSFFLYVFHFFSLMFGSGPFTCHLATPCQNYAGWKDGWEVA